MTEKDEKIFLKTHLDEGDVVCDKCGKIAKRNEVIEIRDPTSTWILHQHKKRCSTDEK